MSNGSSVLDESASALFAYAASEIERSRLLPEDLCRSFERSDLQYDRATKRWKIERRKAALMHGNENSAT
jgi:hypothetical protein